MGKASRKKSIGAIRDVRPAEGESRIEVGRSRLATICLALVLLVILTFGQVVTHEFINYDDPDYVSANPVVQKGLTVEGVKYAFTSVQPYYWQPLTWLSLELFGANARAQLVANVLLHAAAVVLLFLLLEGTTGAVWPSAFAAAIWAVHPLRIESVAWVAERKDVLSTVLFLATVLAYVRGRRVRTYVLFALALMAKPMVVTLPVVLLLVDIWPLRRRPTIKDKVPLAVIAAVIVAITFIGQRGAIADTLPIGIRLSNAIVSYVAYLGKMLLPIGLAVIYPYSYEIAAWKVVGSALLLIAITAAVVYARRPHITAGWFWYLVTLLPVIGIVQVGPQSMADRFTYIPSIGIIVAIVWSVPVLALGIAAVLALCAVSIFNLRYWRDSITLFTHAVEVTDNNALAHLKLGDAYLGANRPDEANEQFSRAVVVSHGGAIPLASAGAALVHQKRYAEAIEPLQSAIDADPSMERAHENYGEALLNLGRSAEAITQFETALRLDDGSRRAEILHGLGAAKQLAGRGDEGIADLRASIELTPTASAWNDLASAYSAKNDVKQAENAFTQALRLDPDSYDAHLNYAALLSRNGRNDEAATHIREAMRINPQSIEARIYLALVNAAAGKKTEAATLASEAQQMDARAANEDFTRALHLTPKDSNLQEFVDTMRSR